MERKPPRRLQPHPAHRGGQLPRDEAHPGARAGRRASPEGPARDGQGPPTARALRRRAGRRHRPPGGRVGPSGDGRGRGAGPGQRPPGHVRGTLPGSVELPVRRTREAVQLGRVDLPGLQAGHLLPRQAAGPAAARRPHAPAGDPAVRGRVAGDVRAGLPAADHADPAGVHRCAARRSQGDGRRDDADVPPPRGGGPRPMTALPLPRGATSPPSALFPPGLDVLAQCGYQLLEGRPRPAFGDDRWSLAAIRDWPKFKDGIDQTIDFAAIHNPVWRTVAKEFALCLLQPQYGIEWQLERARREPLGPHVLANHVRALTRFFNFLSDPPEEAGRGPVLSLARLAQAHCDAHLATLTNMNWRLTFVAVARLLLDY